MQRRTLWLVAGLVGGAAVVSSLGLAGLVLLVGAVLGRGWPSLTQALLAAGLAGQGLALGLPLALQGWAAWQGRPSGRFELRRGGWLLLGWTVCLGLGSAAAVLPPAAALMLLPVLHAAGMALAAWALLWLGARRLRGAGGSWREAVVAMAGGGIVGMVAALGIEVVLLPLLGLLFVVMALFLPGGAERLTALLEPLQDPARLGDLSVMAGIVLRPTVVLALLVTLGALVPAIEEALKTLAVGLAARWGRPSPARAYLWGLASGAGFALAENMLNGALGGADGWAAGAVSRLAATLMHVATGALVGWGWGELWTARRPLRLAACYVAAVAVHGLWNAISAGVALLGLARETGATLWARAATLGLPVLVGLLGALAVALVVGLVSAGPRLLAQHEHELTGVDTRP